MRMSVDKVGISKPDCSWQEMPMWFTNCSGVVCWWGYYCWLFWKLWQRHSLSRKFSPECDVRGFQRLTINYLDCIYADVFTLCQNWMSGSLIDLQFTVIPILFKGSPNCPTINTTVNTTSLAVSIQKEQMRWLPEWYYVGVSYYDNGLIAIVYNSTLRGPASFDVTPVQPGTVYNISVIPCNMAGCNESCDIYSVQTTAAGEMGWMHYAELKQQTMYKHCFSCNCCCLLMYSLFRARGIKFRCWFHLHCSRGCTCCTLGNHYGYHNGSHSTCCLYLQKVGILLQSIVYNFNSDRNKMVDIIDRSYAVRVYSCSPFLLYFSFL